MCFDVCESGLEALVLVTKWGKEQDLSSLPGMKKLIKLSSLESRATRGPKVISSNWKLKTCHRLFKSLASGESLQAPFLWLGIR